MFKEIEQIVCIFPENKLVIFTDSATKSEN